MADTDSQPTVVRSYALVFKIERKLFRIDRWRLPLPGGLEVRAILYATTILLGMLIVSRLPGFGLLLGVLPAPLHWGLIPGGLTFVLLKLQIEGRAPHRVLASLTSWYFSEHLITASGKADRQRVHAPIDTIWIVPDWQAPRYRTAEITGPARVVCRYPVHARVACNSHGEEVGDMHLLDPNYGRIAVRRNTFQVPPGRKLVFDT
jgi:hypothetical protein